MGEESAKTTGMSTMIVENNITYRQELKVDEEVDINLIYFNHDKKRLHYKFEMINKGNNTLSATFEALALYVNLKNRKVSEFEQEKISIMQKFIRENKQSFNQDDLKYSSKLKL
jgi:acyl-CoA thioester hydrolase